LAGTLHIDFVTETYAPEVNGVAMTLGKLVGGLLQRDCTVEVFRPRQSRAERPSVNGRFREHLLPGMRLPLYRELRLGFPADRALYSALRRHRPDALYVATEGPLGWSAVRVAAQLAVPTLSGFHTNFHSYSRHYRLGLLAPLVLRYLCRLHRRTGCTLVPTSELAAQLREHSFGRVEVMQRGVDTALFNPARRDQRLRQEWGAGPGQLVCLYVGRIAAEKNILTAVRAFRAVQEQTPSARLVLVGDGPMRNGLATGNPDFVFRGVRRGEDLARHYASGDLFLFPSQTETFGNVVTEAMASGLTVVAYPRAAAGEHIRDGDNGALADGESQKAFIERAVAVAQQAEQRASIGHNAAASAAALDWDSIVERFLQLVYGQIRGGQP
jgi:glycosyltransferase involved in cell wall biosynthesis